jgi:hypothetical protein
MRRAYSLALASVIAVALGSAPSSGAPRSNPLDRINVTYRGGPLLQHVKVSTLFWGSSWKGSPIPDYLNSFFTALFADGRYMANLAQYSAGGYTIGNGEFAGTTTDDQDLSAQVTDAQIQAEIGAQVAAGGLPQPDPDTLYVVVVPGSEPVTDPHGTVSTRHFNAYHYYSQNGGFAYAVVIDHSQAQLTKSASHEMAEAVTDPQVDRDSTLGWYDDRNGEIGDIPNALYAAGRIGQSQWLDVLVGSDGTQYVVQTEWSNQNNAPVAFAPVNAAP